MNERARDRMIAEIEAEVRLTAEWIGRAALAPRVMQAMARVPRDRFVPAGVAEAAFDNCPLPIGHGQTISQPYIVALMTDLLEPRPDHTVLEVGTGSGYQAAVLSLLVARVYSVEIVAALADTAARRLAALGYDNVVVRAGDGAEGWAEHAPFEGIMVTACVREVPPRLVDQLKPGGRLVVPVGDGRGQTLRLVAKDAAGAVTTADVLPVAFVPLTHRPRE